jgi:predicted transcriptional regulator
MLHAANGGASRAKIMYCASLGYEQMRYYLPLLLAQDLLEFENESSSRPRFRTTDKGLRYLGMLEQIEEMIVLRKQGEPYSALACQS